VLQRTIQLGKVMRRWNSTLFYLAVIPAGNLRLSLPLLRWTKAKGFRNGSYSGLQMV